MNGIVYVSAWNRPGYDLSIKRGCLTSRHAHVGADLEAGVDEDDGAPHHLAGEVPRDELHGGGQVVPGLVVLLSGVVWRQRN